MEATDLKKLEELVTEIRICMAKMETNQKSFGDALSDFREERLKTYDIMTKKIETLEEDVKGLDKKITYAAGVIAAVSAGLSLLAVNILKKLGLS